MHTRLHTKNFMFKNTNIHYCGWLNKAHLSQQKYKCFYFVFVMCWICHTWFFCYCVYCSFTWHCWCLQQLSFWQCILCKSNVKEHCLTKYCAFHKHTKIPCTLLLLLLKGDKATQLGSHCSGSNMVICWLSVYTSWDHVFLKTGDSISTFLSNK